MCTNSSRCWIGRAFKRFVYINYSLTTGNWQHPFGSLKANQLAVRRCHKFQWSLIRRKENPLEKKQGRRAADKHPLVTSLIFARRQRGIALSSVEICNLCTYVHHANWPSRPDQPQFPRPSQVPNAKHNKTLTARILWSVFSLIFFLAKLSIVCGKLIAFYDRQPDNRTTIHGSIITDGPDLFFPRTIVQTQTTKWAAFQIVLSQHFNFSLIELNEVRRLGYLEQQQQKCVPAMPRRR